MKRLMLIATLGTWAMYMPARAQENKAEMPHTTQYTVRIAVPEDTEIHAVGEGIVTLKSQNKLAFYSIGERKMLTGFDWQEVGGYKDKTAFSGGACAVKQGMDYVIVYPDGTIKQLKNTDIKEIGNFHDGIAPGKKKKGDYGSVPAFFDKNGKAILGALTEKAGGYTELNVREMQDGLRAIQVGKWGFIDAANKIVIEPKYSYVSDFSEGMALVSSGKGMYGIIDKKGKVIREEDIQGGYQLPRAFHDGWAFLPAYNSFVNPEGKVQDGMGGSSDFCNGWAFSPMDSADIYLVDKTFSEKKCLKGADGDPLSLLHDRTDHMVSGCWLLQSFSNTYLFDWEGRLRLATDSPRCKMSALFDGGFIALTMDKSDSNYYDHDAVAVCTLDGRIRVVFDRKARFEEIGGPGEVEKDPEEDNDHFITYPITPEPDDSKPIIEPPIEPGPEPIDDKDNHRRFGNPPMDENGNLIAVIEEIVVNIDKWPTDDNSKKKKPKPRKEDIKIHTSFGPHPWFLPKKPGDEGIVTVETPDGSRALTPTLGGKPMEPVGPGAFKGKLKGGYSKVEISIVPEEDPEIEQHWALGGHCNFSAMSGSDVDGLEADICLMTNPDGIAGTPFGEETKGLFIVNFDPKKKFTPYWNGDKKKPIPNFASYFWGPSRVLGFEEEYGQKYIYMTGGITAVGNWMEGKKSDIGGLLITLLVSMSSFDQDKTAGDPTYVVMTLPHKYRLAYEDLPDGGMKLGMLERYSPEYGWVRSDDKRLIKKKSKNMTFMTMTSHSEKPMEADILKGFELHWMQRPTQLPAFYPGRNWFPDNEQYQHMLSVFDRMYHSQTEKDFSDRWYTHEECREFLRDFIARESLSALED